MVLGCQDDQAKVRRLDQAGDDHVKSTEYILLMVQKSGDHHLGCIKLQNPSPINNGIFTISTGDPRISSRFVESYLEALETPCVRYERAATPRLMQVAREATIVRRELTKKDRKISKLRN